MGQEPELVDVEVWAVRAVKAGQVVTRVGGSFAEAKVVAANLKADGWVVKKIWDLCQ